MNVSLLIQTTSAGMFALFGSVCLAATTMVSWTYPPLSEPAAPALKLLMSGGVEEAVKDIELRMSRDAKDPSLWVQLMCARSLAGSEKEALEAARMALRLRSPDAIPFAVGLLLKAEQDAEAMSLVPHLDWLLNEESAPVWLRIEAGTLLISHALAAKDHSRAKALEAKFLQMRLEDVDRVVSLQSLGAMADKADLPSLVSRARTQLERLDKASQAGGKVPDGNARYPFPESSRLAVFGRVNPKVSDPQSGHAYPFPPVKELAEELRLVKRGDVPSALARIKAILDERPKYARGWRFLGSCHATTGDFLAARNCYSNAVMLQDGPAVVGLVKVGEKLGDLSLIPSLEEHLKYIQRDDFEKMDLRFEAMHFLAKKADQERAVDQLRQLVNDCQKLGEKLEAGVKPERAVVDSVRAIERIYRKWGLVPEAERLGQLLSQ